MSFLIGTDEAGYGPSLGPLVVAATVWELIDESDEPLNVDLYARLRRSVCRRVVRNAKAPPRRLPLADSKSLYNPSIGLGALEQGVLVALGLLNQSPSTWHEAWEALSPSFDPLDDPAPWHADYESLLPLAASASEVARFTKKLKRGCQQANVRLCAMRTRAVFPDEFNELLLRYGNKSDALSMVTLELLSEIIAPLAGARVSVICDKHGGRNHYAPLLQHHFPDWLVEVCREGRAESCYRFGPERMRTLVSFRVNAERYVPAALASMTAKYVRELAMRAFNDYWCRQMPELRPTAGYSRDAQRFKREIEPLQTALGIEDRVLWRTR